MLFNLRVNAEDIESLKQSHMEIILKCAKDNPVSPEDIEQFKKLQLPDNGNAKCLFACTYKLTGMMDDQGMLSVEGVNALARKFLSEDPERLKKAEQFTDACKSVNDVEVSDGNKGCERAALMFKCSVEKAPEFDFIK
ncbi:unnamed protein product, partial [Brenthis ino]